MLEKRVKTFIKTHTIVGLNEEDIEPLLFDFLQKCIHAKRKKQKNEDAICSLDKDIIFNTLNVYISSIYFNTNELCEHLENKEAIIDVITQFAYFCINYTAYSKQVALSNFECTA